MKIIRTLTLFLPRDTLKTIEKELLKALREAKRAQNYSIKNGSSIICGRTKFSNSASRLLPKYENYHISRLSKSRLVEMDRSEAYRLLSTYQLRFRVSKILKDS